MENKDKKKKDVKKIKKKYLKIKKEINIHNKLYYDENNPKISDVEYDKLWKELKNLEETFPFLKTKDSPITKIGHKPNQNFSKIKHNQPMLSLENALNLDEVKKYIEKIMRYLNIKNQLNWKVLKDLKTYNFNLIQWVIGIYSVNHNKLNNE